MIGVLGAFLVILSCLLIVSRRQFSKISRRVLMFSWVILLGVFLQACSAEDSSSNSSQNGEITQTQYQAAKKEHKELVATNKKLDQVLKDTNDQRQKLESEADSTNQATASDQSQNTNESTSQSATTTDNSQATTNNQSQDDVIKGGSSQYIIGNVNSHVYHLPGQRGYTMKSKNAVYFNSEQEAINAGYRKARQ